MSRSKIWDYENRMILKALLNDGYRATDIARKFDINNKTVYDELKKGMDMEVYREGRFSLYDPFLAMITETKGQIGEQGYEALREYIIKTRNQKE